VTFTDFTVGDFAYTMTEYLKDLNTAQAEAVTFGVSDTSTVGGPLLIIAGAGSGKTNTLAYRTAHLVRSDSADTIEAHWKAKGKVSQNALA
jgi:hypothetical protein